MKNFIIALIVLCLSFINLFSQSGWFPQNSGTGIWLHSIGFFDSNTGLITGYSSSAVLRTTNGGSNWYQSILNQDSMGFFGLFIINVNTGWIAGNKEPNSPYPNAVYKTTNSGLNWILQYQSTGRLADIFFINAQTGWIAGQFLLKTTNSGTNWYIISSSEYKPTLSVFFLNENTGWVGGNPQSNVSIMKTTNGGSSWVYQLMGDHCYSILFTTAMTGYAATFGGIKKSSDSGSTWNTIYSADYGVSLVFANSDVGWALAQWGNPTRRQIVKTTNAGYSWTDQGYTDPKILNNIFMLNVSTGWVVGDEGVIYKTTNGGVTGFQPISNVIPEKFSLYQNYPNPFNPSTKIKFSIPPLNLSLSGRRTGFSVGDREGVLLKIYDILGRNIATLVNEQLQPGTYEVDFDGSNYPSGIYFYKITAGSFSNVKKMILLK